MASKSPWLTECDPISLEPLRLLRYPPFECRADLSLSHCVASDWFDGRVLASYLVSTGNFTHPISRRELTRADCAALDRYLVENCLSITSTSRLFPEGSADKLRLIWSGFQLSDLPRFDGTLESIRGFGITAAGRLVGDRFTKTDLRMRFGEDGTEITLLVPPSVFR